ncbi:S1C family serine protease [Nocardia sp. NPDC020380]|uniref:S1C family serine protease n=1 Tax=Nocardia sp. NPDC020380 TaxID=3364309 RepID=UPI003793FBB4
MSGDRWAIVRRWIGKPERIGGLCVGLLVVGVTVFAGEHLRADQDVRVRSQMSHLGDMAVQLARSVVAVHADGNGSGSGIVLDGTGLVLTNSHVVDRSSRITVADSTGTRSYRATRVGTDALRDVALLKLESPPGLPVARIDPDARPETGSAVLAVGYAGGSELPVTATGTLVAVNQSTRSDGEGGRPVSRLTGMLAIDNRVAPGDSGGGLFDADGRVVGMITSIDTGNPAPGGASAFAIPIDTAVQVARSWASW